MRNHKSAARQKGRRGPRTVLSIMGPEGHGKTNLALTAPKPLIIASVDPNTEDVVCKVFGITDVADLDPEIGVFYPIAFPAVGFEEDEEAIKEQAAEGIEQLTKAVRSVDESTGTFIMDTGTEVNELNILERFGRTDKISPQQRVFFMGTVNARYKGFFRQLKRMDVHTIVTHRAREVYETVIVKHGRDKGEEKDVKVPGKYERIGFKQMGNIINTEVLVKFDPKREGKLSAKYGMEITRCMIRPSLIGKSYWGRKTQEDGTVLHSASFPFLMMQLYPGTTVEDWQ